MYTGGSECKQTENVHIWRELSGCDSENMCQFPGLPPNQGIPGKIGELYFQSGKIRDVLE